MSQLYHNFFRGAKTRPQTSVFWTHRAGWIFYIAHFHYTGQLREIPEISRLWFTTTIHTASALRSTDWRLLSRHVIYETELLFITRSRCTCGVNSRHFVVPFCAASRIQVKHLLHARAILTSLSETSITRYRIINSGVTSGSYALILVARSSLGGASWNNPLCDYFSTEACNFYT